MLLFQLLIPTISVKNPNCKSYMAIWSFPTYLRRTITTVYVFLFLLEKHWPAVVPIYFVMYERKPRTRYEIEQLWDTFFYSCVKRLSVFAEYLCALFPRNTGLIISDSQGTLEHVIGSSLHASGPCGIISTIRKHVTYFVITGMKCEGTRPEVMRPFPRGMLGEARLLLHFWLQQKARFFVAQRRRWRDDPNWLPRPERMR